MTFSIRLNVYERQVLGHDWILVKGPVVYCLVILLLKPSGTCMGENSWKTAESIVYYCSLGKTRDSTQKE